MSADQNQRRRLVTLASWRFKRSSYDGGQYRLQPVLKSGFELVQSDHQASHAAWRVLVSQAVVVIVSTCTTH